MQYRIFDHIEEMSAADVDRLLRQVSRERGEKALRYKHLHGQWTCLKAAEMLGELLHGEMGTWQYNEYGKPYIEGGLEFSISHCRAAVAVAVDAQPVGIDVESIRPYNASLARRVMNEQEMREIEGQSEEADARSEEQIALAFTRLWTQKEAVLKLRGTGIIDDMKEVLVNAPEKLITWENREKGYCVSIAETR